MFMLPNSHSKPCAMSRICYFIALVAWVNSVNAQDTCNPGSARAILHGNDVRAAIYNNGSLFWSKDSESANMYEVPAGGGVQSLFMSSLWVAGRVGNGLRSSITRYGDYHLRPGTIDASIEDCKRFDRIYSITRNDLNRWNATGVGHRCKVS